jgi:hypothetical protein
MGMGGGMTPMGMSPGMMGGGPAPSQKKKAPEKKRNEDEPELHAAGGASEEELGSGSEPTLPASPLTVPEHIDRQIGTDTPLDEQEQGRASDGATQHKFYGLYYAEESGKYGFRSTLPPLWMQRTQPSRTNPAVPDKGNLYGLLYFNRRSAERADDILFPLFFNLRDRQEHSRTTIVGPLLNRRTPTETDDWIAPLWFSGTRKDGNYRLIPPLLYYDRVDATGGLTIVGPGYCKFKGGTRCDTRTATDIDLGVAPFYFYGQSREAAYELIPPLLHYYEYNDRDLSWTNVWGPYYRSHTEKRDVFHVLPFYWSLKRPNGGRHTTVFPLFHYGHEEGSSLFVNPLFLTSTSKAGAKTFVTWGYARHRGRTELDMITPLFWHFRDPDAKVDEKLLFPFYYSKESPRESTTALFPFWARKERYGISRTTFVTPFFEHSTDLTGWSTNIHPILYLGRSGKQSHTVIAPFFFDFAGTESRATVAFPLFWRFSDLSSTTQLVGNVYYTERKRSTGLDWAIHVFPLFSYGETPQGHFWNVLYGLAGYTREGQDTTMRTLWIPIPLTRASAPAPDPSRGY